MLILVPCQAHGEDSHGWNWQSEILGFNPSLDVRNIIWVNLFASLSFNFSFVKSPWKTFLTHWSFLLSKIIFAFTGWCGVWLILVSKHQFNLLSLLWVLGYQPNTDTNWVTLGSYQNFLSRFPHPSKDTALPLWQDCVLDETKQGM